MPRYIGIVITTIIASFAEYANNATMNITVNIKSIPENKPCPVIKVRIVLELTNSSYGLTSRSSFKISKWKRKQCRNSR